MALKDTVKDPLNWVLLILALAFGYYVAAIPYWQNYYLKTPQEMTMADYLANPSHPRPFMLRALGSPPSSIEVVLTDLTVEHIDSDSILLSSGGIDATPAVPAETPAEPVEAVAEGEDAVEVLEVQNAEETSEEFRLVFVPKAPLPNDEILIAGENMDLLEFSVGQQVSLQLHGLHESPLGWVPLEANLSREDEEYYTKDEIDELDRMRIYSNGNEVAVPYVESAEMRFGVGDHGIGEPITLETLSNDTTYIQTANRLQGVGIAAPVDLYDVRLVGRAFEQLVPYFFVEDAEGRRARVFYNSRLLHEWYWALDRLQGQDIVVRGRLQPKAPADLRQLEADGNVQATLEGVALLSRDGSVIINLENPAGTWAGPSDSKR